MSERLILALVAALGFGLGCHVDEPRGVPSVPEPPAREAPGPAPAPAPDPAPVLPVEPAVAPPPSVTPASPPLRTIATWPFTAWDRAEVVTYNHVPYGPGVALRAYDAAHGWSPKIALRRAITPEQGTRAVQWVIATRGEVEVSKCAFPRHAVVLLAGDVPVGSVNVCFECGDILVWPDLDPPPDYEHWSDAKQKQQDRRVRKQLAAYKTVFPQWERFFRDELGLSLTPVTGR